MVYIKRDRQGEICDITEEKAEGYVKADENDPEVKDFVAKTKRQMELTLLESDISFIRVLEDLIEVLMEKNIISITDFPPSVIDKLLQRQSIRNRVTGSLAMELFDEDNEEDSESS